MFRFALQRYGSWEWLEFEAALVTSDGPEWALSSYGVMNATVPSPAAHRIVGADGRPLFEVWGTLVHVELGQGDRRWTGIVKNASLGSGGWDLTIVEHPGYLAGIPYLGLVRGVYADPAALMRQLLTDTQSIPNAWYGCTVEGSTPVRIGTELDDQIAAARAAMDARKQQLDSFSKTSRTESKQLQNDDLTLADEVTEARSLVAQGQQQVVSLINDGADAGQINAARESVTLRQSVYQAALLAYNTEIAAGRAALANAQANKESAQASYDAAKDSYDALRERRKTEEGAYEIRGDDLTDTYKALKDIATYAGVEWTTRTRYTEGAPDVGIIVHYPAAGRRRDDLVFDTGTNILAPLELSSDTDYANTAIGVGAGEGTAAVRRIQSVPHERMYRPVVIEDRTVRTSRQMDALMRAQLNVSSGAIYPETIEVRDHPNCPIGSWGVGDIITASGVTTIGTFWEGLVRIESWSWPSRYRAVIRLSPTV